MAGIGRPARRASIVDVARHAGVAVGTVSNVLNRPDRVSAETRDRVRTAIDTLGFVRNASARRLRAGSIPTIGAVVLDIANPFFTEVARGVEDRLSDDDYTLMLASSDGDPEREGGARVAGARGAMPQWGTEAGGELTDAELLGVVCHERYTLSGGDATSEEFLAWCAPDAPNYTAVESGASTLADFGIEPQL